MLKFARHHPSPTGAAKRSSSVDRGTRHSPASLQIVMNGISSSATVTSTTSTPTSTLTRCNRKSLSQEVAIVQRRSRTSSLERVVTANVVATPLSSNESTFTRGISLQPASTATTSSAISETPTGSVRTASIVATSYSRSCSPPPPLPQKNLISTFVRQAFKDLPDMKQKSQQQQESPVESNYEAIFSGTLCREQPQQPSLPSSRSSSSASSSTSLTEATAVAVVAMKGSLKKDFYVNNHLYEPRSDFHRAVVKLVEKMDLQLLDTSSESGYGSDQDSLNNLVNLVASSTIGGIVDTCPPPIPSRGARTPAKEKKSVRFDSYVMLLQGLRERNMDLVRTHVREVCDEALATEEVVNEFLTAVIEGNEPLIREMLANGFNVNASDPAGMTPLHLAATFNYLPLVRLLLSHGAAVFARTHSSGNIPSELSSRRLPGFQACHAYLRCMEECLGVANKGRVHVTQPYRTCRCDELAITSGETLTVIRKGDYAGSSWWWCENSQGQQGYVLQDLLALNKPTASIRR